MNDAIDRAVAAMNQQDADQALAARIAEILGWEHDGVYEARDGSSYYRVVDGVANAHGAAAKSARCRKQLEREGIEVSR